MLIGFKTPFGTTVNANSKVKLLELGVLIVKGGTYTAQLYKRVVGETTQLSLCFE